MNVAVVVRTGLRVAARSLWSAARPRRGLLLVALTSVMALAFGITFMALFGSLAGAGAPLEWSRRVLGWAFTLALVMLVLGDLHVVVAAMVDAPDLGRLRASPITPRQLLALKLVETLPRTLPPVLGIALPAALAYASVHGGVGAPALACALLALWAVPLGLGSALALPLLRVAPLGRLRESLAMLATLAFVAGWLANTFWMPRLVGGGEHGGGQLTGLGTLPPPPAWSPATWAARAVGGPWPASLADAIACVAAAVVALGLASAASGRLVEEVQARAAGEPGRLVRGSARRASTLALAFLRRDRALVARDWPVVLDALAGLALWMLLPLAVLPLADLPRQELARGMLIALSVGLGNDVAARALPLERGSLAWARLSPVGAARWVLLRAAGVALAGTLVALVAVALVSATFRLGPAAVADLAVFALCSSSTAMASGLLLGAFFGEPEWIDPRAMLGVGGRSASAAVLLAQAAGWFALSLVLAPGRPIAGSVLAVLVVASAAYSGLLLALAARQLGRREDVAR